MNTSENPRRIVRGFKSILFVVVVVALLVGSSLGMRFAALREMQLYEDLLVGNLAVLSSCKRQACDANLERYLIQENDMAMMKLQTIENAMNGNPILVGFGLAIFPFGLTWARGWDNVKSGEELRSYYQRLGCGINSTPCSSRTQ